MNPGQGFKVSQHCFVWTHSRTGPEHMTAEQRQSCGSRNWDHPRGTWNPLELGWIHMEMCETPGNLEPQPHQALWGCLWAPAPWKRS